MPSDQEIRGRFEAALKRNWPKLAHSPSAMNYERRRDLGMVQEGYHAAAREFSQSNPLRDAVVEAAGRQADAGCQIASPGTRLPYQEACCATVDAVSALRAAEAPVDPLVEALRVLSDLRHEPHPNTKTHDALRRAWDLVALAQRKEQA